MSFYHRYLGYWYEFQCFLILCLIKPLMSNREQVNSISYKNSVILYTVAQRMELMGASWYCIAFFYPEYYTELY